MTSLAMRLLKTVAEVPAAASEVLILTVLIWVISSAIFSAIYLAAAGSRRANNGPMKGANLRARVNITFEEAVFGCEKELEIVLKDECTSCHGTVLRRVLHRLTCPKCNGEGQIVYTQQSMFGMVRNVQTCPDCHGYR